MIREPLTAKGGGWAEALAHLKKEIGIALEKGFSISSVIDHLIESSAPIPESKVRKIVGQRYDDVEALAEQLRAEMTTTMAAGHEEIEARRHEDISNPVPPTIVVNDRQLGDITVEAARGLEGMEPAGALVSPGWYADTDRERRGWSANDPGSNRSDGPA